MGNDVQREFEMFILCAESREIQEFLTLMDDRASLVDLKLKMKSKLLSLEQFDNDSRYT